MLEFAVLEVISGRHGKCEMMKNINRELLMLVTDNRRRENLELELNFLQGILASTEDVDKLMVVYDLLDIQRRKIYPSGKRLLAVFRAKELPSFLFLHCLN